MTPRSFLTITTAVLATAGAQAAPMTFDDAVVTGPSAAPGVWYTDRYAPAGFTNENFGGENVLKQTISAADGASSRPSGFSAAFYNTQGRKLDAPTGATSLSIDLYIDASWTDTSRRYAGLWGTAFDGGGTITAYPIIEFGEGFLRYWNGSGWVNTSAAAAFGSWMNLSIELGAGMWNYEIDGTAVGSVAAGSSLEIGNVILQGHNTTAGVSYDIRWDNLDFGTGTGAVPLPGTLALAGLALLGLAAARRRQA
jgi:hypothetical protein